MQPHQQQPRPSYGAPSGQATVYGAPNLAQYGQPMAGQAPSQVSYGGHSMQPSIVSPQSYGSHPQQPTGQVSYGGALPVSAQQSAGQVSYGSTSQISAQQPLQSARPMSPPSGQPQQAAYYSSGQYSGYGHVAPMAYGSPHQAPSANVASPPLPSQARPPLPSSQQMYQGAQPVPPIPSMPPMPQSVSPRQMYQQPTAPPAPKVSPAQMPNVVAVQEADEARHSEGDAIFRSSVVSDILPPLPTTSQVTILDDGNCSPRFMRSTLYHVPNTEDLLTSARLPLSIIIQPFAKTSNHLPPIPVVDFGPEHGPLRCTRCRAYINPFVKFLRGGRSFECNICSMVNDVPDSYFCNLDATGRRTDLAQRPELVQGTVDFVASKEYIMRKPEPPYLLFMVDASRSAVQNGAFMSALIAIREIIEQHLCGDQKYHRMAIITFDKNIGVYDLRASEAQILVMSDIHEPFVPLHDGLFFDPLVAYEQAFALLDRLPSLFMETRIVDSCAGAAAAFAVEALKGHGGRAILFSTTLPNVGVGLLRNRDASAPTNADKVNPLVLPHGDFFSKLGLQASSYGVSFVIVSTPAGYIDMATLGTLHTV